MLTSKSYNSQKDLKRAKRHLARKIFYAIIIIFIFAGGFYFLFFSNFFIIKDITINGNYFIASTLLTEKFKERGEKNLILLDPSLIREQLLKEFPRLDEAQIQKKYPNKVIISVKERETQEILCRNQQKEEQCFFIDKNGIVFDQTSGIEGFLIIKIIDTREIDFKIGDRILNQEFLEFTQKLKQSFSRLFDFNIGIMELNHPLQKEVTAKIGSWRAIFDIASDVEKQLFVLKQVLEKEVKEKINKLDYIDLRIEGKAYYKINR